MQNLSEWITGSIGRQQGLFCAVFVELNKPHVKILCITPGRLFHSRILTYLRNVATSDVATDELRRAFVAKDTIELQVAIIGVTSLENNSAKELRRELNSKVYSELEQIGRSYEPWISDFEATHLNLKASLRMSVNAGQVESITPSAVFSKNCESLFDVLHQIRDSSHANAHYLGAS
jgi:hypothetical protein